VSRQLVYEVQEALREPEPAPESGSSAPENANLGAPAATGGRPARGSQAAAPAPMVDPGSEIDDECPVCGNVTWVATDGGYVCGACQYEHGEVAAVADAEEDERGERRVLIESGRAA
jgi:hypothetical protein